MSTPKPSVKAAAQAAAPSSPTSTKPSQEGGLTLSRSTRWGLYLLTAIILVVIFQGYLSPDVAVAWDSLLALCGIR